MNDKNPKVDPYILDQVQELEAQRRIAELLELLVTLGVSWDWSIGGA